MAPKTFSIYIYNAVEEEWNFISSHTKNEQKKLLHDSNRFADCYLFVNAFLPSFAFVSPIGISDTFKEYFESLSNARCTVLTPKEKTPFICDNIACDKTVFSNIVSEGKKAGSLTIYTYVTTKKVFDLKRKFEEVGINVFLPEMPEEKNLWTVGHFGSKSGFRTSFAPLMPKGSVELNYKTVRNNADTLFESSSAGIVLKTDKGDAGQGVYIFKKNNIKTKGKLHLKLQRIFKKEPYLKKHPLILETFIDTQKERKCPFPSVECFIHQNGKIEIPYYCNMIVTPEGEFYGMEMNNRVFSKRTKETVLEITMKIAKTYKAAGYRGRFDIDMINNGEKIFANESNTRTNGGTDTYLMVKKLVGKNFFTKRYVISSYTDLPKKSMRSFLTIKKFFASYLFDKKTKTGLIINSESVIQNGGFSYILVGENKKKTIFLHETIKEMLTNYKNEK